MERALTGLGRQVPICCLTECDASFGRLARRLVLRRLELEQGLRQFLLGVVLRPLRLVAADLPAVDLRREAPGLALGALARALPQPLVNLRHLMVPVLPGLS